MTLIKCPGCGHTVSSVASRCPQCGDQLSQFRFVQGEGGGLTECRRCSGKVLSGARVCPYCGVARPGRRSPVALLVLAVALALPMMAIVALRNRAPQPPPAVEAQAQPVVEPPGESAAPASATQAELPRLEPSAPLRAPAVAPDSSALAAPTQTKWTLDWANVRERRELQAPVVRVLRPGASVQVNDRQLGWWALYLDGRMVGYVAGSVLGDQPPFLSRPDTAGGHD